MLSYEVKSDTTVNDNPRRRNRKAWTEQKLNRQASTFPTLERSDLASPRILPFVFPQVPDKRLWFDCAASSRSSRPTCAGVLPPTASVKNSRALEKRQFLFTISAKLFDLCGQLKLLSGRECIIVKRHFHPDDSFNYLRNVGKTNSRWPTAAMILFIVPRSSFCTNLPIQKSNSMSTPAHTAHNYTYGDEGRCHNHHKNAQV